MPVRRRGGLGLSHDFRRWRHAMKTVLAQESRGTLPEDREKMVATIFYPDAAYGAQLVGAFQRAIAGLGEMEALDPRPWRLDVLQWPEMKAEASHDVACSRVIVVPADEAYAGSEFFRRWVEDWPAGGHGRRGCAPGRGWTSARRRWPRR